MYEKPFNILEVETRFLILDDKPFSTLESKITQYLDARKIRSLRPATDLYFDPSEDFSTSKRNGQFQRLRNHVVYENGIPSVKQTKQTKKWKTPAKNKYGIKPWLETQNHAVRDLNEEIEKLTKKGYHFLNVHGDRNEYSTNFRDLTLQICFDRMLSPKGAYVEIGTEREVEKSDVENVIKNNTSIIADFIDAELKKLSDNLGVETKIEPIYPLILLE